jgi:hypothetical protein
VELGRVDIFLEVSMMFFHVVLPRERHLEQVFHIFAHLKKYHNTEVFYDPSDPVIDEAQFDAKDWASSEFGHLDGVEELPPNMPEPRGQSFVNSFKVDADHASDAVNRRSRTGFLVWINSCLVYFLSKKQTSVETSSFGSEFVAMKSMLRISQRIEIQAQDDGDPSEWSLLYLWKQTVGVGKRNSARLHAKEEFTENCIPFCP